MHCLYSSLYHFKSILQRKIQIMLSLFTRRTFLLGQLTHFHTWKYFFLLSFSSTVSTSCFIFIAVWWTKLDHDDEACPVQTVLAVDCKVRLCFYLHIYLFFFFVTEFLCCCAFTLWSSVPNMSPRLSRNFALIHF